MRETTRISLPFALLVSIVSVALSVGATSATFSSRLTAVERDNERQDVTIERILALHERLAQQQADLSAVARVNAVQFQNIERELQEIKRAVGAPNYRGR